MLSVTLFSNFFNHHQLPLSLEFYNNKDIKYYFVATEPIPEDRIKLGYEDMNSKYSFIIKSYESDEMYHKALDLANNSDVVIMGDAPEEFIQNRINSNKLTFRYSERIYKKGRIRLLDPRIINSVYKKHTKYRKKNVYMLCAGAYTAKDYALNNAYIHKTYKWGYFPETKQYNIKELLSQKKSNANNNQESNSTQKKSNAKILWVGRFLDWKHPEKMISLGKRLRKHNIPYEIIMIGCGEEEKKIKSKIEKYGLTNEIKLLGSLPYQKVREKMEQSNIFIITSDQGEGWGAVLNEAMNSGCAVIANDEIGSAPFLINHRKNRLFST